MLDGVFKKIKMTKRIEKPDDNKILIDTDDELAG